MQLNADITVINSFDDCYYSLFIKGVSMQGKSVKTATEKGLVSADYMTVRIPVTSTSEMYLNAVKFKEYAKAPQSPILEEKGDPLTTEINEILTTENSLYWLLVPQKTYIVVGEVTPAELIDITKLLNTREVYTISSVGDNRHGSLRSSHWRCDLK